MIKVSTKVLLVQIFFLLSPILSWCQLSGHVDRTYNAKRATGIIKIDGVLDDVAWNDAETADDFLQLEPIEGDKVSQRSQVRLLYDDKNIYIAAMLFDSSPDSVLQELGNRDEGSGLNADAFRLGLDPYNIRQAGYVFEVSVSGVQTESYNDDISFDAVWESQTQIRNDGWSLEMRIPYSAIRFPAKDQQVWGLQFGRLIRRNREYDQWSLTPKDVQNKMAYWGTLVGMSGISAPLRLSITPYLSVYAENAPVYTSSGFDGYHNSYSYSGGADLKLGLDERFTLDVTLLPDFSQVQSDDKVKNLTAFETIYSERRPFFNEGTDLFSKGNLFYSRRIGKTPSKFYSIPSLLEEGEQIEQNPDKARLLNATKVSGRTDKGLGIGLLNAITNTTHAKIKRADGSIRQVETEPLTNYNILVLDQQLKNNSKIFIANTNVMREGDNRDANVTAAEFSLENKKNKYQLRGGYSMSRIYTHINNTIDSSDSKKTSVGNQYFIALNKIKGSARYGASYEVTDKKYDKNDAGYLFRNDYSSADVYLTFYKFNPFWKHYKYGYINFYMNRQGRLSENNLLTNLEAGTNFFLLFKSNWSLDANFGTSLAKGRDYYEPRVEGMFYHGPYYQWLSTNMTSNYNKKLAFDFGGRTTIGTSIEYFAYGYYIIPRLRISDKWTVSFSYFYDIYNNDLGFVTQLGEENATPVFGQRDITTITNTLTTRYLFKNDMSISLTARHYWSQGKYARYYLLKQDGRLTDYELSNDDNFNSNYITADLVYNWQFAPGSFFLITYKNQIFQDSQNTVDGYLKNFGNSIDEAQINSISLKILYYLDYQALHKKKS
ncbi:MAG TPA: DUF5916 domain-containing protein [Bacteroidia bacterium]|nr:DUF5916 domain-containing protein [Bacteroidia bacterium]HNS12995.1 DUF5916 domain-containing protein [Bacteroidia bacterium]